MIVNIIQLKVNMVLEVRDIGLMMGYFTPLVFKSNQIKSNQNHFIAVWNIKQLQE